MIIILVDVLRNLVLSDMELLVGEFIVYWIEYSFVICFVCCLLKYINYWWKIMIMGFKCVFIYILLLILNMIGD